VCLLDRFDQLVSVALAYNDPVTGPTRNGHRRVVMTTCQAHGAAGFTNLLVTKEDRAIVLNPHLANCCVLRLDEKAATDLHNVLGEWLG
jgi:hypothetical protein